LWLNSGCRFPKPARRLQLGRCHSGAGQPRHLRITTVDLSQAARSKQTAGSKTPLSAHGRSRRGGPLGPRNRYLASVLIICSLDRPKPIRRITHIAEYKDCEGRHLLPLFGTKRFVQWLPRLGEFIQVGGSLSQCFRASLQKGDWITIAHQCPGRGGSVVGDCALDRHIRSTAKTKNQSPDLLPATVASSTRARSKIK